MVAKARREPTIHFAIRTSLDFNFGCFISFSFYRLEPIFFAIIHLLPLRYSGRKVDRESRSESAPPIKAIALITLVLKDHLLDRVREEVITTGSTQHLRRCWRREAELPPCRYLLQGS